MPIITLTLGDDLEHIVHYPAIQRGHESVALGGRNEVVRHDHSPGLVAQTQENFNVPYFAHFALYRCYFLRIKAKAILVHCHVQPLYPGHLAKTHRQRQVIHAIRLDPVAASFLGHVTGHIGGRQ